MKAIAVFPREKEIRVIDDHPEPQMQGPQSVRLEVLQVGVCGTDREIARFDYGEPPKGSDYFVLGHESLMRVTDVGSGVKGLEAGDLAVMMVRRPCTHRECTACRQGRQDFCYTGDFTERGIRGRHGFMTEHVVDDAAYVVRLPRELREVGVLVEPLTIAEKALIQVWDIQERLPWKGRKARSSSEGTNLHALVLGAGPVGLLGAMALRRSGFNVHVYSREPADGTKAKLVRSIGARYVSAADDDPDALCRDLGPVDLVYEAVGASDLAFHVLRVLAPNAVFVFTGVPGRKGPIEVDTSKVMRQLVLNNQVVFGTVNAGRDAFEAAVRGLTEFRKLWPEAVSSLITGRFRPEDHAELLKSNAAGIKNVIEFS